MSNKQPDIKIVLKNKSGGNIQLAAFWTDGERPSGGLDRRIKRLKVEWEDQNGELHTETVINNGKDSTHYCNLWNGPPTERASATRRGGHGDPYNPNDTQHGGGGDPEWDRIGEHPPSVFDDDDCPF